MKNKFKNSCAHNKFYIAIFIFIIFIILLMFYYNNVSSHRNNLLEKFIEASDNKTLGDTIVPIPPLNVLISSNDTIISKVINLRDLIGDFNYEEYFIPYNKSINCNGTKSYLSILIKTNNYLYGFLCTSNGFILLNSSNNFTVNPPIKNIKDIIWTKNNTIYFSNHYFYFSEFDSIRNNNSVESNAFNQNNNKFVELDKENPISIGDKAIFLYSKKIKNKN